MCVCHSNGISVFFQSGGGTSCTAETEVAKEEKVLAWGTKIHRPGEVVLVSKTHVFSLNLLPLSGAVWLYGGNHSICPLPCSNYDKKYYKRCFHIPTHSCPDLEEHPYGAKDPWALPT